MNKLKCQYVFGVINNRIKSKNECYFNNNSESIDNYYSIIIALMEIKKLTLIEKAKAIYVRNRNFRSREYSKDEIDLAIAWAKREVKLKQIKQLLNMPTNKVSVYLWLIFALREAISNGYLIEKNKIED